MLLPGWPLSSCNFAFSCRDQKPRKYVLLLLLWLLLKKNISITGDDKLELKLSTFCSLTLWDHTTLLLLKTQTSYFPRVLLCWWIIYIFFKKRFFFQKKRIYFENLHSFTQNVICTCLFKCFYFVIFYITQMLIKLMVFSNVHFSLISDGIFYSLNNVFSLKQCFIIATLLIQCGD